MGTTNILRLLCTICLLGCAVAAKPQATIDWDVCLDLPDEQGYGYPRDFALDADRNILACGSIYDDSDLPGRFGVIKYTPDGNEIWRFEKSFVDGWSALPYAIALDNENNIIVTGEAGDSIRTIKLNPEGELLWEQQYASNGGNVGLEVKIDKDNNIIVAGYISVYNAILLKYNADGELLWTQLRQREGYFTSVFSQVDEEGNIYMCYGDVYDSDDFLIVVCKFNPSGELL